MHDTAGTFDSVKISHYGPVYIDTSEGGPYFRVEWRLLSIRPWQDRTSLFEVDFTQTADNEFDATRDVVIKGTSSNSTGFETAGEWRIRPIAGKVRCAYVSGNPDVEYNSNITGADAGTSSPVYDWYFFKLQLYSGSSAIMGGGEVTMSDLAIWSDDPFEANADGSTNSGDLSELIDAMDD